VPIVSKPGDAVESSLLSVRPQERSTDDFPGARENRLPPSYRARQPRRRGDRGARGRPTRPRGSARADGVGHAARTGSWPAIRGSFGSSAGSTRRRLPRSRTWRWWRTASRRSAGARHAETLEFASITH